MIKIFNNYYYITDIKNIIDNNNNDKYSDFENKIFKIVYEWISGKDFFIFKTSGSTGKPKEIKIHKKNILISIENTKKFLKLEKNMNSLLCISTDYIGGFMMLIRALEIGMNITVLNPLSSPFELLDNNSNFDFSAFVPLQINKIIKEGQINNLEKINKIIIGGASLNYSDEKELEKLNNEIYSSYGMTETISHIALRKIGNKYFKTLGDIKVKLDNRDCLVINGNITNYNDLITNDIAEINNENQFIIKGRYDNVINSGGYKIFIEEVEKVIEEYFYSINYNSNFFIAKLSDDKFGETCNLFIEDNFNKEIEEKLLSYLQNKLNKYQIPKKIFFIDKFEYTESSKINKIKTLNKIKSNQN